MDVGKSRSSYKKDHISARKKRNMNQRLYTGDNAVKMIAKTIDDTDQLYAYNIVNYKVSVILLFLFT